MSKTDTTSKSDTSECNTHFTVTLLQKLLAKGDGSNIVFSPLSISVAFGMVAAGAKGATLEELKTALGFTTEDQLYGQLKSLKAEGQSSVALDIANRVYIDRHYDLISDYVKHLTMHYDSKPESVDFAGKAQDICRNVNDWVARVTNNLIKNLLSEDSISSDTALLIVNAVYFKGTWAKQFSKQGTSKQDFYVNPSSPVNVDMMYKSARFNAVVEPCMAVKLPYKNSTVAMYVILPPATNPDIDLFVSELTESALSDILSKTNAADVRKVLLFLPKFELEYSTGLVKVFKTLGVNAIFSDSADLSGISTRPVKVSDAIHKAHIIADEEGTEAAAATAIKMVPMCARIDREQPLEFKVNRPFLFVIATNETILFAGVLRSL